jgi:uncharacterized phage protein (TIGR02218 family)
VPAGLAEALDAPLNGAVYLFRLVRADGAALGFTSHDRTIALDGMTYLPSPGVAPFAVRWSAGLDSDGTEIAGALSHDLIADDDLKAGRFDGARLTLSLVDWSAPEAGTVLLFTGTIGDIGVGERSFEAVVDPPTRALDRDVIELTSPECRAAFGDRRCQMDLSRRQQTVVIAGAEGGRVYVEEALAGGAFAYGRMRMVSGRMAGQDVGVLRSGADWLELAEGAALIAAGDRGVLTEGCDKRWATCRDRFENQANFRGEPFVPGSDSVLRYPGV